MRCWALSYISRGRPFYASFLDFQGTKLKALTLDLVELNSVMLHIMWGPGSEMAPFIWSRALKPEAPLT